jgi:hypothetical protein
VKGAVVDAVKGEELRADGILGDAYEEDEVVALLVKA